MALPALISSDIEYWKGRLIHRNYPEGLHPAARQEFSVRIDHTGTSCFFPLGTSDENQAAQRAMEIYQSVVSQGWPAAGQRHVREFTLAFRWLDNPVSWTYTTIHTQKSNGVPPLFEQATSQSARVDVVVVEPDAGIRFALAGCANSQEGFGCKIVFATAAEALREIPRRHVDFVLTNYVLPNQSGTAFLEELHCLKPDLAGLLYSVYEDSDLLFKATPGGKVGYMLKRTPPLRIFEPIIGAPVPLTQGKIASCVREYFQQLVAAVPHGPSVLEMAKLTPREQEILALLSKGHLAKEIADALGISIWTVHGHVKSVFEKLNVHTRTEAVVKFLQK